MDCEIEFLPVGEKSKGGDAILIRYGDRQNYSLMIVDGGNSESGQAMVKHVRAHFGQQAIIPDVVLTHADGDHASGLRDIVKELDVRRLWLHIPWLAAAAARPYFANKNWTDEGLAKELFQEYDIIAELVDIAIERNIPIYQPFAGSAIGPFQVLSPAQEVYGLLLPQFDRTPEPDQEAIEAAGFWIGKEPNFIQKLIDRVVAKAQNWITESWDRELLRDGGITSASNESSVVLYGDFGPRRKVLLTGDAGLWALNLAASHAEQNGLSLQDFMFVQVPHHGSRRNVGPAVLNRILGPIQPQNSGSLFSAYVSAPKNDDSHPRKMVLNAFTRRGGRVHATQGINKVFCGGFPFRPGYSTADPMPFSPKVEDYD